MLDALISGKLAGAPTKRQTKGGKPYAAARVWTHMHDGNTALVSVSAFDAAPMAALLVLQDGDAVALAGPLTLTTWTDNAGATRPGGAMVVHNVLTSYSTTKKRKAQQELAVPSPGAMDSLF